MPKMRGFRGSLLSTSAVFQRKKQRKKLLLHMKAAWETDAGVGLPGKFPVNSTCSADEILICRISCDDVAVGSVPISFS